MLSFDASKRLRSTELDSKASTSAAAASTSKPHTTSTPPANGNPALLYLKERPARPLPPGVANAHAERGRRDISAVNKRASAVLRNVPPPDANVDRPSDDASHPAATPGPATANAVATNGAPLERLPVEVLLHMNLDPQQMQHVSRTLAGVFHETAVVESLTRADNAPRARSLPAVSRDLDQLEASVSISHRHGPLAVLCTRLSAVPREQRAATLDLLFDAAQKCESPFEPLTELFRQTENWPVQDRGPYLARMMDAKGGAAAKVAASADDVLAYDGLPRFVEDLTQLAPEEQPAVLGVLAKQLLGLHHLQAHDFMKICEDFHELPWPRAAAAGLLGKIGWLRPDVHERMTALSRQPA